MVALEQRLVRAARYQLMLARQRLGALRLQPAQLTESFNRREQRIDALRFRMEAALRTLLYNASTRVAQYSVAASLARLRGGLGERARTVQTLRFRLQQAQEQTLRGSREQLQRATAALLRHDARQRLQLLRSQWGALDDRLARVGSEQLRGPAARHQALALRLARTGAEQLRAPQDRYASLLRQLQNLSPLAVLSRGYALVFDEQGTLVKRAASVHAGELLTLRLAEGAVRSRVQD